MDRSKTFDISVQRFDEFASAYARRFADIGNYRFQIGLFCDFIAGTRPKILELACGPGNITGYLKQRFPESEILAVDLAPGMIELARSKVQGVDFRIMDVREISGLPMKFDSIMCSFCLPFLSKDHAMRLIDDCARLLKESGVFYLSTMEGSESDAGFESTSFSGESKVFFNYHSYDDLERGLIGSGFTIRHFNRQDYIEPNDIRLTDMIFIAVK
jgi:SAM-dependent methyltransferase